MRANLQRGLPLREVSGLSFVRARAGDAASWPAMPWTYNFSLGWYFHQLHQAHRTMWRLMQAIRPRASNTIDFDAIKK